MPVADELVTILGVEVPKSALAAIQSFKAGLDSAVNAIKPLAFAATGFAAAAGLMVKSTMDEVAALQTLSDKSGVSTTSLQEWAYAAKQVGVSAGAVQGDLAKLQQSMRLTGKSGEDRLEQFAARLSGMSEARAMETGKALGLSDDTIILLRQGADGVARLRKEAHDLGAIIPEDAIERSESFRQSVTRMTEAFKGLRTHLAIAMMPALQRVTDLFTEFIVRNRAWMAEKTESFMHALVNAWEKFWSILKKVLDFFKPLVDKFRELTSVMDDEEHMTHVLQGALGALLIIFAPLIAKIAALAAAFYAASLVVEDFMYWLNGDESLIGYGLMKFAEKFPGITKLFEKLRDVAKELFNGVIEWAQPIINELTNAWVTAWEAIGKAVDELSGQLADWIDGFTSRYPNVVAGFKAIASFIQDVFIGAIQSAVSVVKALVGWLKELVEMIGGTVGKALDWLNEKLDGVFGEESGESKDRKAKAKAFHEDYGGFGGTSDDDFWSKGKVPPQKLIPAAVPASGNGGQQVQNNDNRQQSANVYVANANEVGPALSSMGMGMGAAQQTTPGLHSQAVR